MHKWNDAAPLGAGNDLLLLVLDVPLLLEDCKSQASTRHAQQGQRSSLVEQILYFVAAYLMMSDSNQLAVYAVEKNACTLVHCSLGEDTPDSPEFSNPTCNIRDRLLALLSRRQQEHSHACGVSHTLALSAALSRALCLVHRLQSSSGQSRFDLQAGTGSAGAGGGVGGGAGRHCRPRALCVVSAADTPAQYIPMMNAIFSAQRAEVAIDCLMLGQVNSVYLQQAAHLTGGLYIQVPRSSALDARVHASTQQQQLAANRGSVGTETTSSAAALQYMLSCMTADISTRSMLKVHQPLGVDFRASCFCHKAPVDVGLVCSVCLSIYCEPMHECMTCGSKFKAMSNGAPG